MDTPLKIYVVEDHEDSREELLIFLRRQGWIAEGADCGEELNRLFNNHGPSHIVMLDLNLPHEDGLSIASRLKEAHPGVGVVILSARTTASDRLKGYETGADVYLHKPVNPAEIKAVIANLSRRLMPAKAIKGIQLAFDRCLLILPDNQEIKLTQTEARVLRALAQTPSREADAEYLIASMTLKSEAQMTRESLQVHVSRIRSKVPELADGGSLVTAIRGYGYRLNTPLLLI